jgi:hypothetical protein
MLLTLSLAQVGPGCASLAGDPDEMADEGPAALVQAGVLTGRTLAGDALPEAPPEAAALARLRSFGGPGLPGLAALLVLDDLDGAGGYAHPLDPELGDPEGWILVAAAETPGDELDRILAHEYGHIATLDGLPEVEEGEPCDTLVLYGNCPPPGSILRDFLDTFWVGEVREIYVDVRARHEELDPEGEQELIERLSARDDLRDRFVSAFAMVDPAEDLAETYAALALGHDAESTWRGGVSKLAWLAARLGAAAPRRQD